MIRMLMLAAMTAIVLAFAGGAALAEGDCSKAKGEATTQTDAPKPISTASTK